LNAKFFKMFFIHSGCLKIIKNQLLHQYEKLKKYQIIYE